jgi:hypothetical protein
MAMEATVTISEPKEVYDAFGLAVTVRSGTRLSDQLSRQPLRRPRGDACIY